jgi:acyl-CoA synthetase (AMP-forming)/AMP-acid ligase II
MTAGHAEASTTSCGERHLIEAFYRRWQQPERSGRLALADDSGQIRYPQLFDVVGHMAGGLRAAGVQPGDRVAIAVDRSARLATAIIAVMAAGACPCPFEPRLSREETCRRFAVARLAWLLLDSSDRDEPPVAGIGAERRLHLDALPQAAPCWALDLEADAPGLLLFTSGTSGKPKGVLQSHRGLLSNAHGVIAHTRLAKSDLLLHIMPLHHTNGVNNQVLAPLLAGSAVILAPRFRAEHMPALMQRVRPTLLTGVPTMYARMLPFDFTPQSLDALRMLRCGSAPISEELHRRIEAKFGRPLVVSYGLSEATCTSTMNPPEARRIGSVGTVLAGQHVHLRSTDGSPIEAAGRSGEICIGGPNLMLGYITEQSAGSPEPPGSSIRTGDIGYFDAEGYLFVTGRIKDIIIRGGENLSPQLIEAVLGEVPGVGASCVVGRPDADLGEVPVAFVVRDASAEGAALDGEQLRDAVMARLSRIHRLADVIFVDSLPENSVGKVDRAALAARCR